MTDRNPVSHRPVAELLSAGRGLVGFTVQPLTQFLPRLEERDAFGGNRHGLSCPRITPLSRRPRFDRKRAKPPQFNPVTAPQRIRNFVKYCIDDTFDVALVQMRVCERKPRDQFGFDHANTPVNQHAACPPTLVIRGKSNSRLKSRATCRSTDPSWPV